MRDRRVNIRPAREDVEQVWAVADGGASCRLRRPWCPGGSLHRSKAPGHGRSDRRNRWNDLLVRGDTTEAEESPLPGSVTARVQPPVW